MTPRPTPIALAIALAAIAGAATPPAKAEPVQYAIDGAHTHIVWMVDRFGFAMTVGTFADVTGALTLDEDSPEESAASAEIAVKSVRSDLAEREEIVTGPFWLNAEEFPIITFKSTSVRLAEDRDGKKQAIVTGDLSLRGVTAPVTMSVLLNKIGQDPVSKKKAAGFTAQGTLMRSDFGVDTAIGPVGDEVSFRIEALAVGE